MTLQSTGAIAASDIATEFDDVSPTSLSEFYGEAVGLPASGEINYSDFYGVENAPPWDYAVTSVKNGTSVTHQSYADLGLSITSGYDLYALVFCFGTDGSGSHTLNTLTVGGTDYLATALKSSNNDQSESRHLAAVLHPVASASTQVTVAFNWTSPSSYTSRNTQIMYFQVQSSVTPTITDTNVHTFPSSFNVTTTNYSKTHTKAAKDYVFFAATLREGVVTTPTGFDLVMSEVDTHYDAPDYWTAISTDSTSVAINETLTYGQQACAFSFVLDRT